MLAPISYPAPVIGLVELPWGEPAFRPSIWVQVDQSPMRRQRVADVHGRGAGTSQLPLQITPARSTPTGQLLPSAIAPPGAAPGRGSRAAGPASPAPSRAAPAGSAAAPAPGCRAASSPPV